MDRNKYIEVPSIGLAVSKVESNIFEWDYRSKIEYLHSKNQKILTPLEYLEFIKEAKNQDDRTYQRISGNDWFSPREWLDAEFEDINGEIFMIYHKFENGKIVRKVEPLDKDTLKENKFYSKNGNWGISLDYLIENPNSQGLAKESNAPGIANWSSPKKGGVMSYSGCSRYFGFGVHDTSSRFIKDIFVRPCIELNHFS